MLILALDSAMNGCSAGLHDFTNDLHISELLEISRGQAEHLMPMINTVLANAGKEYKDIELIAVTHGPGAFTGIRVAMATAKALGLSLDIPVIGVCTFEAVLKSFAAQNKAPLQAGVGVLLETKRDDFYFMVFDSNLQPVTEKMAVGAESVLEALNGCNLIIGDANERFLGEITADVHTFVCNDVICPDTKEIAKIAVANATGSTNACSPVYIRPPDATPPKNLRTIRK